MGFLQPLECLCVKAATGSITAQSSVVKSTLNCSPAALKATISAASQVISPATRARSFSVSIQSSSSISSKASVSTCNISATLNCRGEINEKLTAVYSPKKVIEGNAQLNPLFLDKFAGEFGDNECIQKIYPIADVSNGPGVFVGPNLESTNLYSFIDEGVATGDIDEPFGNTELITDDDASYIQPSSITTNGSFRVKFGVTSPTVVPRDTSIRFRAAAPIRNYESLTAPQYTIKDIKFEDPSGNLIALYNDIVLRGDADLYAANPKNYTTYSSFPKVNNAALYEWQEGFPLLRDPGQYTLSFNIDALSLDDPFDDGYNSGFAVNSTIAPSSYPYYAQPTKNIRISAIEICASGGIGPSPENYIPIYTEVQATGRRIERRIFPALMPVFDFDTGVYPTELETRWELNSDASYTNTSATGSVKLIETLNQNKILDYIKLNSTSPINDSGKLLLKFSHSPVGIVDEITKGSFNCAFDESICGMWITPSGAFNTLNKDPFLTDDHFFVVDTVSLRILAKKAPGSRDYSFDVVGYSDDKILNVTSAVGGFLQNIEGIGDIPLSSGFNPTDDLGFDGETFSDRDQYFESSGTNNAGGDHYLLSTRPVVNSTEWRWYEVPLKVYEDTVALGASKNYNMSSYFENLFLDIFPLPTGAAIAKIELLVRYAPQNALMLATQGGEMIRSIQDGRSEGSLYPVARQSNDDVINAAYEPISLIENIPHAFATPSSIKTNYGRRWRGMEGTVQGAFDVEMFDFGYNNPLLDFPFLSGYYDFDYDIGNTVVPRVGPVNGTITSTYSPYKYKNIGWRFTNDTLFEQQLPGYTGNYLTTDWTALSSGATNFQLHPLYGKIADAFNNIVRLSGQNSNINFGRHEFEKGFSVFVRFSPDANYQDLFESGVIVSKWDSGQLEFAIGYSGGYLTGYATNSIGKLEAVHDTVQYDQYQYPLNVILTYNDHESNGLKLYTDNELANNWNVLRASSVAPFVAHTGSNNLRVGWCPGSGIGANIFVSEFGFSTNNIVYANPDATLKEVTAQKFLENSRMKWWQDGDTYTDDSFKLWSYVDENTYSDWKIGDFKFCMFSPAFDQMQKRTGRDLISFNIVHDGLAYSQRVNMPMPSSVSSGVAYHTQIENDFLRLHLSDTSDNFYSTYRRITKSLPRGYKFSDKALVVETVLEHETNDQIVWSDGQIGPKLIVSLYTKRQEPYWIPDENNWGLVNRSIHYIEPSSCFMRVDSTFTYDSLIDQSEEWALFPNEPRLKEFGEKYFSQDVDDMFLQYDLVYPSGPAFASRIDIHSAHVRLQDAYVLATQDNETLNVFSSGGYPVNEYVNLTLEARQFASGDVFNLYTIGPILVENSGMPIYTSGILWTTQNLGLSVSGGTLPPVSISGNFNISVSGGPIPPSVNNSLTMHMFGKGIVTSQRGDELGIALTAYNDQVTNIPDPNVVNLFTFGSDGVVGAVRTNIPMFVLNDFDFDSGTNSGNLNLISRGSQALFSRYPNGSLNLFISNDENGNVNNSVNLTLYNDPVILESNQSINLLFGANGFVWNNVNYGTDINVADNIYASLPANDEIRGVDLIGYGSCDGDSPRKAIDPPVVTHDTVWREATCNEGGIFRAINTYTNLEAGYSGDYYGIRKFTGLLPNTAYNIQLDIVTGSTEPISIPREWEEFEYGTNDLVNFSGVKLIDESGRLADDKYGSRVAVKKDLIAVGSPFHEIEDEYGNAINNAGSVFLYRRNEDVAGLKASWDLEDVLILPSGYRRDFISRTYENLVCYPNANSPEFCISGQKWNIGQEGREFGHALDIAKSGEREVVVVGAPGASWSRNFDTITTSGIPVCMMVFVDQFDDRTPGKVERVANVAKKYDLLYKYFSATWPEGFQPQLNTKIVVCEYHRFDENNPPPFIQNKDWLYHTYLFDTDSADVMQLKVKSIFESGFPYANSINSGIPPIVGIFKDTSASTANGEVFNGSVETFINYYKPYAYNSGVKDVYGVAGSGYVSLTTGIAQSWDQSSIDLIENVLSTGNLINNNALRYITSGIGQQFAQPNAYEFQIPPTSGGRVYIFEKEFGEFNLVQEIKPINEQFSNNDDYLGSYGETWNDRFGHSVAVSENGEIITIGSPYAENSPPCQIYERDETEYQRLLNGIRGWLVYKNYTANVGQYDAVSVASGEAAAKQDAYRSLNKSDKFAIRHDSFYWGSANTIKQYKNIYNFRYEDIPYIGTWAELPLAFCGTSRLGYSTAVSEDGNYVAFGAPTDSFNEFDDLNMWEVDEQTWPSYVYAGAVRIFESRKYYPHNFAVEYFKFGNLDRNAHPDLVASGYYDEMGDIFAVDNVPFRRTQFSELEIPQEAGLAFIITPEIDAASDEIIQNIKDWLSLGNRTLVLVGNDPTWEENGLYRNSNAIINKILEKLNSRMRIVSARQQSESLPTKSSLVNVTKSFVPEYSHSTYIEQRDLFAQGVADIKIDLTNINKENLSISAPCDAFIEDPNYIKQHPYCVLPLKGDLGDLRAEWQMECVSSKYKERKIKYKENWPFHFGNQNPAQICDDYPQSPNPQILRPYQDPRPILTAAEYAPDTVYTIPATSGKVTRIEERTITYTSGTVFKSFDENHIPEVVFDIFENNDSEASGEFVSFDIGNFFDPNIAGNRDSLMQATGTLLSPQSQEKTRVVSEDTTLMAEQSLGASGSKVVLMASLLLESKNNLSAAAGGIDDDNIYFYNNICLENCGSNGRVQQIGGWTGRNSFTDAYPQSDLAYHLQNYGTVVESGVVYNLGDSIPSNVDVIWIANPSGYAQQSDADRINSWLNNYANKKVIITYANDDSAALRVRDLCDKLGLEMSPWYSESEGAFLTAELPQQISGVQLDSNHPFIKGCAGYTWPSSPSTTSTQVSVLSASPDVVSAEDYPYHGFIPVNTNDSAAKIINFDSELIEKYYENQTPWEINAQASVTFATQPGSGYRMFVEWVSELPIERYGIKVYGDSINQNANALGGSKQLLFKDGVFKLSNTVSGSPQKIAFDFVAFDNETIIEFVAQEPLLEVASVPHTVRIVSASGCLLPINEEIVEETRTETIREIIEEWIVNPPQTIIIPGGFRPIKTDSAKYCSGGTGCPGTLIEDGPVVVAEEYENFSSFTNGSERSRIVVVTDSTILQGKNPEYRSDTYGANQLFIRNLYPPQPVVPDDSDNPDIPTNIGTSMGRRFLHTQKIVAPERGSPGKYYLQNQQANLVTLFGGGGLGPSIAVSGDYTSDENNYDPSDLIRLPNPPPGGAEARIEQFIDDVSNKWRFYPRLSGNYNGELCVDPNILNLGGTPMIKIFGKDYLDFDFVPMQSGFRGDLFGFAIDIHNNKLVVGAPFNAYVNDNNEPITWEGIQAGSGEIQVSANGGAGAVFYYERTNTGTNYISNTLPWEFKQKIKPDSLNIGIDNADTNSLIDLMGTGVQNLDGDFVLENAAIGDQFGYDVAIDADFMVVGAPGHDFETVHEHIYSGSAAFIRKEFTYAFDIPLHNFYDMGNSDIRIGEYANQSGVAVLNNGAIFTFDNRIQDWRTREKRWEFAEKIVAQGYNTRNQASLSGCENDFFGRTVAIHRTRRGDADYTVVVGSPHHDYPTSGTHVTGKLQNAGAAYIYDAMLREQEPKIPSENNWIEVSAFAAGSGVKLKVYQNASGDSIRYSNSGIIYTNSDGSIFLEGSGYDPSEKGFIAHRPYVESIIGFVVNGIKTTGNLSFVISGMPPEINNNMNLSIIGPDSSFVYNNVNLHTVAWNTIQSSGFPMFSSGEIPVDASGLLNMTVGGVNIASEEGLNLRTRGV